MSRGPGRWQRLILAALRDVWHFAPVWPTNVAVTELGGPMTQAEYRAVIRATWLLNKRGALHAEHERGIDYTGRVARRLMAWTCPKCSPAGAGEHIAALPCLYCKKPTDRMPIGHSAASGYRQCADCAERIAAHFRQMRQREAAAAP